MEGGTTQNPKSKIEKNLKNVVVPDVELEDIEDDGKPLFEKQLVKREKNLFFEAKCHLRLYLRKYCIGLFFFSFFPVYYSIIFCPPQEFNIYRFTLVNPAFNKLDTSRQCTSVSKSLQNGFVALLIYYALKIYRKLFLCLLYLCLLIYFGWDIRNTKLEWFRKPITITKRENTMHFIELCLVILQTVLIFPFLVGGYFLIRHVHRNPTKEETASRNEKYKKECHYLDELMTEENLNAEKTIKDTQFIVTKKNKQKEDEKTQERFFNTKYQNIRDFEKAAKERTREKRRKQAEKRMKRKEAANEREPE